VYYVQDKNLISKTGAKAVREQDSYSYPFNVGDKVKITDPVDGIQFEAEVVGADHYHELTAASNPDNPNEGLKNVWVSYTLTSDDAPENWGNRFWAVDSQKAKETGLPRVPEFERAFYVASGNAERPEGIEFESKLSGRVDLSVVGEALHSSSENGQVTAQGILFTYRNSETNQVWAEEVFLGEDDKPERMVFDAIFDVAFELE
jgi:hypothetical protein